MIKNVGNHVSLSTNCNNMKYYLYRHIRVDKNEPFYIGIGSKCKNYKTYETEYKRAYSQNNRSKYWNYIINKTEYIVEILFESNSFEEIFEKEIEFIKLYGRSDLKLGSLCNLTNGGEGKPGRINDKVTLEKMSLSAKLRINNLDQSKELTERLKKFQFNKGNLPINKKSVNQLDLSGKFIENHPSLTIAASKTKSNISKISMCINGKRNQTNSFKWEYQL